MRIDEYTGSGWGGKLASQAYWNALRKLRVVWRDVFDEELEAKGGFAMEAFEDALQNLRERLKRDPEGGKQLLASLDVESEEEVEKVLLRWADIDDLTPNQVKTALLDEFRKRGEGRHDLRGVLRDVFKTLFNGSQTKRPLVGANRHWPRLRQYLRELEQETDWTPDGTGIRLVNASGKGRVADMPQDPGKLNVVVDPDYL